MEVLTNYNYETKVGNYVSERFKVSKGVYDFTIYLDGESITEEKGVLVKTGRELEKYIRKVIKEYEKNLETEKVDETEETTESEDMEEAIKEVVEEAMEESNNKIPKLEEVMDTIFDEELETEEIEEVKEDLEDVSQKIDAVFVKCKSPMEMRELFEIIDTEIKNIDGVNFKATTSDLVYQVMKMNFLRIRPKTNRLDILRAPDYYKNIINLADENEIDNAMVLIKQSCEYIKKKRSKK